MAHSEVIGALPRSRGRRFDARIPLAFMAIYLLWGATFLAIRIAVLEMPPFFTAGVRFLVAGGLLYGFMRLRGQPGPSTTEWRSIAVTALCMFVATYGALFWAEQYVPSGIASVIEATLPITTIALEVFIFRQQPFRWTLLGAVALGFCGVSWLLMKGGPQQFAAIPCLVIVASGIAWSLGHRVSCPLEVEDSASRSNTTAEAPTAGTPPCPATATVTIAPGPIGPITPRFGRGFTSTCGRVPWYSPDVAVGALELVNAPSVSATTSTLVVPPLYTLNWPPVPSLT